jgi:hypothetical protein
VIYVVAKIILSICSVSLKHRLSKQGITSEYSNLILHNEIHLLSMGQAVLRFTELISRIQEFLESRNKKDMQLTGCLT